MLVETASEWFYESHLFVVNNAIVIISCQQHQLCDNCPIQSEHNS